MMRSQRVVLGIVVSAFAATGEPAKVLEDVVQLSGITGGLCAWLEPGNGLDMLALARGGRFLVHGIASDAKETMTLCQRLAGAGLSGFASVEALPLKTLPYADNLVNLIVAEDLPALMESP